MQTEADTGAGMKAENTASRFVVCVSNRGYRASLVVRRIYEVIPDLETEKHGLLRIVDESGEDYLFPEKLFVPIELPESVGATFARAS